MNPELLALASGQSTAPSLAFQPKRTGKPPRLLVSDLDDTLTEMHSYALKRRYTTWTETLEHTKIRGGAERMRNVLTKLKAIPGMSLGIVTFHGNQENFVERLLEKNDLGHLFNVIVSNDGLNGNPKLSDKTLREASGKNEHIEAAIKKIFTNAFPESNVLLMDDDLNNIAKAKVLRYSTLEVSKENPTAESQPHLDELEKIADYLTVHQGVHAFMDAQKDLCKWQQAAYGDQNIILSEKLSLHDAHEQAEALKTQLDTLNAHAHDPVTIEVVRQHGDSNAAKILIAGLPPRSVGFQEISKLSKKAAPQQEIKKNATIKRRSAIGPGDYLKSLQERPHVSDQTVFAHPHHGTTTKTAHISSTLAAAKSDSPPPLPSPRSSSSKH